MKGYPKQEDWRNFFDNSKKEVLNELSRFSNKNQNNLYKIFPNATKKCLDLLNQLLVWNPDVKL